MIWGLVQCSLLSYAMLYFFLYCARCANEMERQWCACLCVSVCVHEFDRDSNLMRTKWAQLLITTHAHTHRASNISHTITVICHPSSWSHSISLTLHTRTQKQTYIALIAVAVAVTAAYAQFACQLIYFEFYEKLFVRAHALFFYPIPIFLFIRFHFILSLALPPSLPLAVFYFSKRIKIHIKIAWLENRRYKNSTRENNSHFSV